VTQDTVETIVRFHDPSRFAELAAALLSLIAQTRRPQRVLLVTHRFSPEALQSLETALEAYRRLDLSVELEVVSYTRTEGLADARTALVNAGIARARGRYLGVLAACRS